MCWLCYFVGFAFALIYGTRDLPSAAHELSAVSLLEPVVFRLTNGNRQVTLSSDGVHFENIKATTWRFSITNCIRAHCLSLNREKYPSTSFHQTINTERTISLTSFPCFLTVYFLISLVVIYPTRFFFDRLVQRPCTSRQPPLWLSSPVPPMQQSLPNRSLVVP